MAFKSMEKENHPVTVRDRDTMKQVSVNIEDIASYVKKYYSKEEPKHDVERLYQFSKMKEQTR